MTDKNRIAEHHLFARMNKTILFNVETMLFYEVDRIVSDMVRLLESPSEPDPVASLQSSYAVDQIQRAASYLVQEKFILPGESKPSANPNLIKRCGIRHLELMITHDCNLRCRYCYGSHGNSFEHPPFLFGAERGGMSIETARRGVDYLIDRSGKNKQISVTFFGGEPLLELDAIDAIATYVRRLEAECGKEISLSLSSNGLLLTDRAIDVLTRHRIGCQISIDGDKALHDRQRLAKSGEGSYDRMLEGVQKLMERRRGRTPARATISHGNIHIMAIIEHLIGLGFGSVHIEPAIGLSSGVDIDASDVDLIMQQNEEAARFLIKGVRENKYFNYTNLVRHIRQTRLIQERSAYYCGAGRTYFALAQDGAFYPCHRFVGMAEYRMGDIETGMDTALQKKILRLTVDDRPGCRDCWARYICGGGCWKHAVDMNSCLEEPDREFSCAITRHLIECAMAINSELKISDKDILSDLYEKQAEPYWIEK